VSYILHTHCNQQVAAALSDGTLDFAYGSGPLTPDGFKRLQSNQGENLATRLSRHQLNTRAIAINSAREPTSSEAVRKVNSSRRIRLSRHQLNVRAIAIKSARAPTSSEAVCKVKRTKGYWDYIYQKQRTYRKRQVEHPCHCYKLCQGTNQL
jgi:ABC-type transport system substrate-binding protein